MYSAAYIGCGMWIGCRERRTCGASCTVVTASRNYVSGLTEAFYRKLLIQLDIENLDYIDSYVVRRFIDESWFDYISWCI